MVFCFKVYKMNKIVNKFLLAGDTFIPEMHLKQPGFTYNGVHSGVHVHLLIVVSIY